EASHATADTAATPRRSRPDNLDIQHDSGHIQADAQPLAGRKRCRRVDEETASAEVSDGQIERQLTVLAPGVAVKGDAPPPPKRSPAATRGPRVQGHGHRTATLLASQLVFNALVGQAVRPLTARTAIGGHDCEEPARPEAERARAGSTRKH